MHRLYVKLALTPLKLLTSLSMGNGSGVAAVHFSLDALRGIDMNNTYPEGILSSQ